MRQYVDKHGGSIKSMSAYENGEHLPRKAYLDTLLDEVDRRAPAPLTVDVRRLTHTLYRRALPPKGGRNSELTDLYDLELRADDLADQLTTLYLRAADLQNRNEQLQARQVAGATVPAHEQEQLRREGAELVRRKAELVAEQKDVQRRIDRLEESLPLEADTAMVIPPRPSVPPSWPVPPLEQASHQGKASRRTPWVLVGVLTVALVLLAVVALRPDLLSTSKASGSTPPAPPQSTVTVTASAPSGTSAPLAAPSVSAGAEQPSPTSGAGWTVRYHDTSITLPAASGECQLASLDFDTPRGYLGSSDTLGDDLVVQIGCPFVNPADNINSYAKAWGKSSPEKPDPTQCQNDANRNALPRTLNLSEFPVGSAYCLITNKNSVAWFKVTGKTGTDQQGQIVQATLWTHSDGN